MAKGIKVPRLSETLDPLAWPRACQRCGSGDALTFWREHDDRDRPEMIFVVLCAACADKIIVPHPRLYARLDKNEPAPGVMQICGGCSLRAGSRCTSPLAIANGGDGLRFPAADITFHVLVRGPGARSGWHRKWSHEPATCHGFERREGE